MFIVAMASLGVAWAAPLDPATFDVIEESWTVGATIVDTDALTFGGLPGEERNGIAVFTFGTLEVTGDLDVRGARPLAILTVGDLTVRGRIDVSAQGVNSRSGGRRAGEGLGAGGVAREAGAGGGHCGIGGTAVDSTVDGGISFGNPVTALEGGSGGGSPTEPGAGDGAAGGGAIELGALGALVVDGNLLANGGDAPFRTGNKGAGGGGAGGGVLLHGASGSIASGQISVVGGNGGGSNDPVGSGGGGGGGCVSTLGVAIETDLLVLNGGASGGPSGGSGEPGTANIQLNPDYDGDEFTLDQDCNDLDRAVNPGAPEVLGDGVDNDCDGAIDEPTDSGGPSDTGEPPDPDVPGDTGEADPGSYPDPETAPPAVSPPGFRLWGCQSTGGPASGFLLLGALAAVRRRTRPR